MKEKIELVKKQKVSENQKIILYFMLYSFLGWCLETIYAYMIYGHFVKRGFLYGPICPIYGCGAVLLILNLQNMKKNNFIKFLASALIFTVFEFAVSFALEAIFNQKWWDYSNYSLNLQGRVCLAFSIIWGIGGVLFINYIHPFIEKNINKILAKIPILLQKATLLFLILILITDEIMSIIKYL